MEVDKRPKIRATIQVPLPVGHLVSYHFLFQTFSMQLKFILTPFLSTPSVLVPWRRWVSCCTWATLSLSPEISSGLSSQCQAYTLCMTLSIQGLSSFQNCSFAIALASHSVKPQLLSMTPSYLQNQYHLGDSFITKSSYPT